LDDLLENMYSLIKNNVVTMKDEVTIEMNDIVDYLTDTELLIIKYGTLGDAPSTLDIKSIVNSQFDDDDYPFNEAIF
jgi:hypothetical protein